MEVSAKVSLSQLQHQLNTNRAKPAPSEWLEEFEGYLETYCGGSYLAATHAKYYHIKSSRPDEWCWMLPDMTSARNSYQDRVEDDPEDGPDRGYIVFLRRTK